jgi:CDGSH-type Zn-finger protein
VESKGADIALDSSVECDVDIMEGGEVRLQVAYDINVDALENQPGDRATLCRCGKSKNKPWCDGRHKGRKDFR